jgi:hypothetical protein
MVVEQEAVRVDRRLFKLRSKQRPRQQIESTLGTGDMFVEEADGCRKWNVVFGRSKIAVWMRDLGMM